MASPAPEKSEPCTGETVRAGQLLNILERSLHASRSEWLFLRELRVGTGRRDRSAQRLDAFALNCLPHLAMKRVCYEIKTSRADYLCELKHPLKRRMGMRYSNEFYFVVPARMLGISEVPAECGLIEAGTATPVEWKEIMRRSAGFFYFDPVNGEYCIVTVPAPWRDTPGPTWQFVAAMLRNQSRQFQDNPPEQRAQLKLGFET